MWTIYSIGDPVFLQQVLNAVAMLFSSADFLQFVAIGFLIGVLIVAFQGLTQGPPGIRFQGVLVSFLLYALLFVPTVSVTIEGAYSGSARVVDNVPLGPAVVGSAVSNLGYGVTRLFEQVFATPTLTEHGYVDALQVLATVRKTALSRLTTGDANSPTEGANVEQSWINYVADCVLYGVDRQINGASMDAILKATDMDAALQTPIVTGTTEIQLGATRELLSCVDAYGRLRAYTTAAYLPKLKQALAAKLGTETAAVDTRVNGALAALAREAVDAQQYMVMAALLPMFEKGVVQHYRHLGDQAAATQTSQAIQQRNSQWATESNLFVAIMKPMMVYFEGFIFAIGPFMAFAIGLGPIGVRMVGKYLLFGLWIQLWMPILAISNLYLILTAQRAFEALADRNSAVLPSFRALYESDLLLQGYLATAGMLIASTPAISLMLIYGSAITATHLAGRLQSGDHVNERLTAPDVLQPGAASTVGPLMQTTALGGTHAPGAQGMVWSFKAGQSAQATLRSAEVSAEQAQESFQSAFGQAFAQSAAANRQTATQYALGQKFDASYSRADAAVVASAEELTRRFSTSGLSKEEMGTLLSAGLKAGGAHYRPGQGAATGTAVRKAATAALAADLAGQIRHSYGVTDSQADEMAMAIAQRVATDRQLRAAFSEGLASDITHSHGDSFTAGLSQSQTAQLTRGAQDVLSTSRSYEQAATFARQVGTDASFSAIETSAMLLEHPAMAQRLEHALQRHGLAGDAATQTDRLLAGGVVGHPEQAWAMAGLGLLLGFYGGARAEAMTATEKQQAETEARHIYSGLLGMRIPEDLDPRIEATLANPSPSFGAAQAEFGAADPHDPRPEVMAGLGAMRVKADGTIARVAQAPAMVESVGFAARQSVADQGILQANDLRAQQRDQLAQAIAVQAQWPRTPAKTAQQELGGLMIQLAETGALIGAGATGVSSQVAAAVGAFGQTRMDGGSLDDAIRAGRDAAGSELGWSEARQAMLETRLAQVAGFGLTPAQTDLYRAASETSWFAAVPSEAHQTARTAVIAESGSAGAQIATLIERAVSSREDSALQLIGQYNHTAADDPAAPPASVGTLVSGALPPAAVVLPSPEERPLDPPLKKNTNIHADTGIGPHPLMHTSVTAGPLGRLLDLVAAPESQGNYNAWYGDARQSAVELSAMTLNAVRAHQEHLLARGNGGSAIGRYQIIPDTLDDLIRRLGLTGEERFTPAMQDRLALVLARDAGVNRWMSSRLDDADFAYNLSAIWAGLPKDASNVSYHAGVGDNAAHIDYDLVVGTLAGIRAGGASTVPAPALWR
ncbi:conjugal transfer protein TraG N-terminal domain-containing protein [Thiocystis violacea]|uniref:conjugal transfer protein TraG N-terminal domain-containing protein n=1 Tax=Thiocystis violacea TaxID=13725 RepID=UPI0019053033|nr:conjugal transfer protein TraG N-terminal domain-containing protein [Thiocystis violacea]MBK1717223.1 conjugal transfer protein TraG [Thiocystis violacea]